MSEAAPTRSPHACSGLTAARIVAANRGAVCADRDGGMSPSPGTDVYSAGVRITFRRTFVALHATVVFLAPFPIWEGEGPSSQSVMKGMPTGPGDPIDERVVADALFTTLYAELHRLARRELNRRGPIGGLGATTLLHEAYLSMSAHPGTVFVDRPRFMGYAARVMRGLIIDDVRRRTAEKRGGLFRITSLDGEIGMSVSGPQVLVRIGDALDELMQVDRDLAEIVDLKFFCGFSFAEIAAMRGVSERTIQRNWEKGRLYLHQALASAPPGASNIHVTHQP
jgi:RNA polymerase sigma factor (TIGR02999 family)